MSNVVFDLDGTLACCKHRQYLIESEQPDWPRFFDLCDRDKVIEPVAYLFRHYMLTGQHRVIIITGRTGNPDTAQKTAEWLHRQKLWPHEFHMRQHGDCRHDWTVKGEIASRLGLTPQNTEVVFEDRNRMVKTWRDWGFTCFQVADGDF